MHLVHHASQVLDLATQLMNFRRSMITVFLMMAMLTVFLMMTMLAFIPIAMLAMDSALDLFGQVVHAGGAKVLDGDHQVPSALIAVAAPFVLVMLPVAVATFAFTMKMSNSLFQFALQAIGFLMAITFAQALDAAMLLVRPAL